VHRLFRCGIFHLRMRREVHQKRPELELCAFIAAGVDAMLTGLPRLPAPLPNPLARRGRTPD